MAKRATSNDRDTKRAGRKSDGNGGGTGGENFVTVTSGDEPADSGGGVGGDGSVIDTRTISGGGGGSGASGEPGDTGAEPARAKRAYRKRQKTGGASALDLTNLNKVLIVSHSLLARLTGAPEFELDESEAQSLAGAMGEVMSHYNVTFLDDKTTAWINLGQVMFGVYGVRFAAARARKSAERAEARERAEAEASRIHPAPTAPAFTNTNVLPMETRQ